MFYRSRNCRLCNSNDIKVGLNLRKVVIGEKYSKKKFPKINKYPLTISSCFKCKNVQTNEIINLNLLWQKYTYLTGQTKAIVKHFKQVGKNIEKRKKLKKNDLIIDIGSNDGSFLEFFNKKKYNVLGVDGAKNVAKIANNKGIKTINKFFDYNLSKSIKDKYHNIKIVTCFNAFAHSSDLHAIIKGIKNILDEDGIFVFECQYLGDIYKKKIIGTFFHEHLYHHSLESLNNLFKLYNLNFFHVEKAKIQKGSIIGYVGNKKFYKNKSKLFKKYFNTEVKNKISSLNELKKLQNFVYIQKKNYLKLFKKFKKNKIGIYGSARSGPIYFENFGMNNKKINYIFDDHKLKVNYYSPLINKKIESTKNIDKHKIKVLIILAYLHTKKIIKKHLQYLKNGGSFITVYPTVKLINYKNYKKYL